MTEPLNGDYSSGELRDARRPIASLISKSDKAQQKLTPGTWQHSMLRDNLKALRIASALMNDETYHADDLARDDLHAALRAFASMVSRVEVTLGEVITRYFPAHAADESAQGAANRGVAGESRDRQALGPHRGA